MSVHLTPGPTPTLRHFGMCPVCHEESHIVGLVQDWYDTIWSCCRCGDSWSGGELLPRPFQRGWRQAAIRRASQKWWETFPIT